MKKETWVHREAQLVSDKFAEETELNSHTWCYCWTSGAKNRELDFQSLRDVLYDYGFDVEYYYHHRTEGQEGYAAFGQIDVRRPGTVVAQKETW